MKRRWNLSLWAGFFLVLLGLVSYVPFFALFPITRDFPWVNLLLFAAGAFLLGKGLKQAFRQPEIYRGKIFGSLMAVLSLAGISLFCFGFFYLAKQLPASSASPHIGQKAPDFTLPDQDGKAVTLTDLLSLSSGKSPNTKPKGALLIFYRGHW